MTTSAVCKAIVFSNTTVLLIENEENILEAIKYNLVGEGYRVLRKADGETSLGLPQQASDFRNKPLPGTIKTDQEYN